MRVTVYTNVKAWSLGLVNERRAFILGEFMNGSQPAAAHQIWQGRAGGSPVSANQRPPSSDVIAAARRPPRRPTYRDFPDYFIKTPQRNRKSSLPARENIYIYWILAVLWRGNRL